MAEPLRVTVLAGGFGGARMAHGFTLLEDRVRLTVIGNTADDLEVHGLHVSPDLDTVMYTLAGLANLQTGWGVRDETWSASAMLEAYGEPTWFRLGDRDLATHLVRTNRLRAGDRLTDITRELASTLGVTASLLPMTDDTVLTKVRTDEGWLDFQDYFVYRRHQDEVRDIRFDGVESARPTPEVVDAIFGAGLIVIAPSNPFVSVAPILALPGVLDALMQARAPVVAISPIVGGAALRGPAAQMLASLDGAVGSAGVAALYAKRYPGLVDVWVLDDADSADTAVVQALGVTPLVTRIVIADEADRRTLAAELVTSFGGDRGPMDQPK